jgi:hypothetical protein
MELEIINQDRFKNSFANVATNGSQLITVLKRCIVHHR